jgi:hypothetical protein
LIEVPGDQLDQFQLEEESSEGYSIEENDISEIGRIIGCLAGLGKCGSLY